MFKSDFDKASTVAAVKSHKTALALIIELHEKASAGPIADLLFPFETVDTETNIDYRPQVEVALYPDIRIHITGRGVNPWDLLIGVAFFQWGTEVSAFLDGKWEVL